MFGTQEENLLAGQVKKALLSAANQRESVGLLEEGDAILRGIFESKHMESASKTIPIYYGYYLKNI